MLGCYKLKPFLIDSLDLSIFFSDMYDGHTNSILHGKLLIANY